MLVAGLRAQPGRRLELDARLPEPHGRGDRGHRCTTRRPSRRLRRLSRTSPRAIGRRLAELHAVLAQPTDDPAFAPERGGQRPCCAPGPDAAIAQVDARDRDPAQHDRRGPSEELARDRGRSLALAPALREAVHALAAAGEGALRTRIHGDFHLGQVLVVQDDAYIIDFEGEPARPLDERRAQVLPAARRRRPAALLRLCRGAAGQPRRRQPPQRGAARRPARPLPRAGGEGGFLAGYRAVHAAAPRRWARGGAEAGAARAVPAREGRLRDPLRGGQPAGMAAASRCAGLQELAARVLAARRPRPMETHAAERGHPRPRWKPWSPAATAIRSPCSARTGRGSCACARSCRAPTRVEVRAPRRRRRCSARWTRDPSRPASSRGQLAADVPLSAAHRIGGAGAGDRGPLRLRPVARRSRSAICSPRAGTAKSAACSARSSVDARRRARRALRGLGAERAPGFRGRRLQRLGRAPPPDAAAP